MSAVDHIEFLLEEPSIVATLQELLPRLLGERTWNLHQFGGKQQLMKKLPARLAGYARWLPTSSRIVVVVDRDNDDCAELKTDLDRVAAEAGLRVKTRAVSWQVANRIAVEELEAWFFGDWEAVRAAYVRVPATVPARARFRFPDEIAGGTAEALEQVLQEAGYFSEGIGKIEFARTVAARMDPARNTSPSFACFRDLLVSL